MTNNILFFNTTDEIILNTFQILDLLPLAIILALIFIVIWLMPIHK